MTWLEPALFKLALTPRELLADRAYDARKQRDWLVQRGCEPVIPPSPESTLMPKTRSSIVVATLSRECSVD